MVTIRIAALLFLAAGLVPSLAYAANDACCNPFICFCYKDKAGDWKEFDPAVKIPANAQTNGEKFKERNRSKAALKEAPKAAEKAKQ